MKFLINMFSCLLLSSYMYASETIVLDEYEVKNINLKLGEVKKRLFEKTVFAIGNLEDIPSSKGILSSRVSGRIIELDVEIGDHVEKGDVLAVIESRQMGDPPPSILLRAPISGVVVSSDINLGKPVEPHDQLMTISNRDILWARASIPEGDVVGMIPGIKARLRMPVNGRTPIEASLLRFGVKASPSNSTIDGIFEVPNNDNKLSPGMRVEFSIIHSSRDSVLSISRSAVQGSSIKNHVFVENFSIQNAFQKTPVVLGEKNDIWVEVISGLFPGDRVVTEGSYALSFSNAKSGMSLKEALDAAHGHEHNEDGSEMTTEQRKQKAKEKDLHSSRIKKGNSYFYLLMIYACFVTFISLWLLQSNLRERRRC